jgi:hypothetical protein
MPSFTYVRRRLTDIERKEEFVLVMVSAALVTALLWLLDTRHNGLYSVFYFRCDSTSVLFAVSVPYNCLSPDVCLVTLCTLFARLWTGLLSCLPFAVVSVRYNCLSIDVMLLTPLCLFISIYLVSTETASHNTPIQCLDFSRYLRFIMSNCSNKHASTYRQK